ncbi:MAG: OmpA family protein [Cyclobacteriaceae bacterium]
MSLKKTFIIGFLTVLVIPVIGKDDPKQKAYLSKADDYYKYKNFSKSAEYYKKYLKKSPDNAQANYNLGVSYIQLKYYEKAIPYFQKAYEINPKVEKDLPLRLGQSLATSMKYKEAIKVLTDYKDGPYMDSKKEKQVLRAIYECNNAIEFMKNPVKIEITNLGESINSREHDFSPLISSDEKQLIFSSVRKGASGGNKNPFTGQLYADLYRSTRVSRDEWTWAKPIKAINSSREEASVSLSRDSKTLIVYDGTLGNGDLYMSVLDKEGNWGSLHNLPGSINSSKSKEASATLSKDELTLFFSSNRKGTIGELDIFMSTRKSVRDSWGEPTNIGDVINTEYNEDAPFLDIDGKTLFFCSEGHKGMGYYDIFKTVYDSLTNTWSEPTNLGYPINSSGSDLFFTLSSSGRHAYFSSAKAGGFGGQDIYRMTMPRELLNREVEEDPFKEDRPLMVVESDPIGDELLEIKRKEKIEPIVSISETPPVVIHTPKGKKITSRQLYFSFNSDKIDPSSYSALDAIITIIKRSPNASIKIEGHTDNVGSEENNQLVSTLRCKAVKKYLVKKGIGENRILAKGYGESKPLVSNDDEVGGREINRRIEFIINKDNSIAGQ